MFKKYAIVALAGLLLANSANGMSYIGRFKAITPGLAAVCSVYYTKSLDCFEMPEERKLKKYPELAKFMAKYRCSKALEVDREKHFLKDDVNRLINAERMKRVIEQEELDRFQVPDKCLYKVDDGDYRVLSQRMEWQTPESCHLSLTEVQQAVKLVEKTGYSDWHFGNVKRTTDGRLGICDTEDFSFWNSRCSNRPYYLKRGLSPHMTCAADANAWLNEYLTKDCEDSLTSNSTYDTDIDFEKVKKQLQDFEGS